MGRRLGVGAVVVPVVMLLAAACAGDDTSSTTVAAAPTTTTTAPPTTTVAAPTTTTESTTTTAPPTTTLAGPDTVGDPAALEDLVSSVAADAEFFAAEVVTTKTPLDPPVPDLTNPDPAVALQEAFSFSVWASSVVAFEDWVPIFAASGSQAERIYDRAFGTLFFDRLVLQIDDPVVVASNVAVVDPTESDASPDELAALPSDAVMLRYDYTVGTRHFIDTESGEERRADDGWTDVVQYAAMVPTDSGWRLAYQTEGVPE